MLDHVSLQARDVEASVAFYLAVFAALDFREALRYATPSGPVVGLAGADGFPHFWLGPADYGVFLRDLDGNNVEAVSHR